jgi:hypothetical protein
MGFRSIDVRPPRGSLWEEEGMPFDAGYEGRINALDKTDK